MKAGAEVHFISGQLFALAVLAVATLPRLPFDGCGVGGKQSYSFRLALICLVLTGVVRMIFFHLFHISGALAVFDHILGTIQVVGQSFLCMTTAYILQLQLVTVINIDGGKPGRSLVPVLAGISLLTVSGAVLCNVAHPNWWCLVNLAEALSCWPVIQTLQLYAATSCRPLGKQTMLQGPIVTQMVLVYELWFFASSLLCFLAEATDRVHNDMELVDEAKPLAVFAEAIRQNQDNGIDDWTRLLLHAVFQNSIDELQHFRQAQETRSQQEDPEHNAAPSSNGMRTPPMDVTTTTLVYREGHNYML